MAQQVGLRGDGDLLAVIAGAAAREIGNPELTLAQETKRLGPGPK
jgi:hypothetical protein